MGGDRRISSGSRVLEEGTYSLGRPVPEPAEEGYKLQSELATNFVRHLLILSVIILSINTNRYRQLQVNQNSKRDKSLR